MYISPPARLSLLSIMNSHRENSRWETLPETGFHNGCEAVTCVTLCANPPPPSTLRHSGGECRVRCILCDPSKQHTSCGKVGRREQAEELIVGYPGVADQGDRGGHHFSQVVRGDVSGHADGDARGAVDQQNLGWRRIWRARMNMYTV